VNSLSDLAGKGEESWETKPNDVGPCLCRQNNIRCRSTITFIVSSSLLAAKGFGSPPPEPRKKSTGAIDRETEDLARIGETIVNFWCNLQLIFLSLEDLLPLDCQS
jgi:hypothetical protein